jgi:hypothetical protein
MQRVAMTFFIHEAKGYRIIAGGGGGNESWGWCLLLPTRSLMKPEGSKGTYALVTRDLIANESVQILTMNNQKRRS